MEESFTLSCQFAGTWLTITEEEACIASISLNRSDGPVEPLTPLLSEAKRQLTEYFSGQRREFTLPIRVKGTKFQQLVWRELEKIPYGATRSYGDIARAIGCEGGARAVGMACHRNPIAIVVPCHRVVGAGGTLTGYAGGVDLKVKLLALEGT